MSKCIRPIILCAVCLISFFAFLQFPSKEKIILKKINSLPIEDVSAIDSFFRIFMLKGSGAYTLFGDKPISYEAYFERSAAEVTSSNRRYWIENKQIRDGWKTWEKYQHLFPSDRYLLKAKYLDDDWVEIILVNRTSFAEKIKENLHSFQEILGTAFSAEQLLIKYENDDLPLFHLLNKTMDYSVFYWVLEKEMHGSTKIEIGF